MDLGLGLGSVKVFAKEDAKLERTALGEEVEGDGDDDLTGLEAIRLWSSYLPSTL